MTATRTPWSVTVLMALGTYVAMFAMTTLVEGSQWLRTVLFVLALVTAADLATRAATRSRLLPTLAALVTAVVVMIPLFAVDDSGAKRLLPTPSAIGDLWQAIEEGARYAGATPAPAEATTPLIALLTGFAVVIFIIADHLAASWRAVAVSGVVLMLPWTPAIFLQYQVPMWALFATAGCWMVAMGAARSSAAGHRSAPLTGAVIATCAALLATVLVVPAALGANGWGVIPRITTPDSLDTSTRLNLALDLRNSLTVNSARVVMTYVTTGAHPDTLRLYTYRDFDGSSWTREKAKPSDSEAASGPLLWPSQVNGWDGADHVILSLHVTDLSERNLPIPTQPRTVEVDDTWTYSPSRDEVTTSGKKGTHGLEYTVVTALKYFTADGLKASQGAIDAGADPVSAAYTKVPSSVDLQRLQSLAADITKDSTNQYEQAVALQNYLRDSANFTYDTSVSPVDGGDAVSKFLDDRHGYCVQFATTMVMLSRSMGIPARLAVGFLGGQLGADQVWTVRSGEAHAWPELYFPGQGWVRFEPTPAVQSGAAPGYTVANSDPGNVPIPSNAPIPTAAPTTAPHTQNPDPGKTTDTTTNTGVAWWLIAVVMVLAGAAAGAMVLLRRRAAGRAAEHGVEAAWASLRKQLPEALRWPLSLTPLESALRLEHDMRAADTPLSDAGLLALTSLRDVVSDHRYAPPGPSQSEVTEEWLASQVDAVVQDAEPSTRSRPDRVGAQSAPRHDS